MVYLALLIQTGVTVLPVITSSNLCLYNRSLVLWLEDAEDHGAINDRGGVLLSVDGAGGDRGSVPSSSPREHGLRPTAPTFPDSGYQDNTTASPLASRGEIALLVADSVRSTLASEAFCS
jgi:hypothetical protein